MLEICKCPSSTRADIISKCFRVSNFCVNNFRCQAATRPPTEPVTLVNDSSLRSEHPLDDTPLPQQQLTQARSVMESSLRA